MIFIGFWLKLIKEFWDWLRKGKFSAVERLDLCELEFEENIEFSLFFKVYLAFLSVKHPLLDNSNSFFFSLSLYFSFDLDNNLNIFFLLI